MEHVVATQYTAFREINEEFLVRYPEMARRPDQSGLDEVRDTFERLRRRRNSDLCSVLRALGWSPPQ